MQIAHTGRCDSQLLSSCIGSILHNDADNIEEVYGGLVNLQSGLTALMYNLGGGQLDPNGRPKNMESTRYSINVLHLQRKLMQNRHIYDQLMKEIEETQKKLEFFELLHPNIIASLAQTYTNTISKLGPRIMIKGDQSALAVPDNAAKIRALLLSATRAALLWDQAGGGRWKLLFERSKMQKQADQLLAEIASNRS